MENCIFCKIIKGEIPSMTIYEDDVVKVFLDINPTTNGDTLIVPKKHIENMLDLDDKTLSHIHKISKEIYNVLKEKLNIDGLTFVQNNFYGQEIKHYHVHLIPRYKNDDVKQLSNKEILKEVKEVFNQIKD